jgi:1-acyl-sn-glycerol-3-phosphate acyltransferase
MVVLARRLEPLTAPLPLLPAWHRRTTCRALMLAFGRLVEVEDAERLAALPEPVIFACNHSSAFEALLVPAALIYLRRGRPVHFLADWMYLELPLLGWLLRLSEPVAIYAKPARFGWREEWRRRRLRASGSSVIERCLGRLAAGGSLGIFPEGTRNRRPGRLLRGRPGVGTLALRSGVPVVPLGIRFPAAARLGRAPVLGRLVLRCGQPLRFTGGRPRDVAREVMAALAELTGRAPRGRLLIAPQQQPTQPGGKP